MNARRTVAYLAPLLVLAMWAAPAFAQDSATALALFEEGRVLMQQGQYVEACAKFAESQRLGPAPGTLLNLGACNAKAGKTASAWAAFNDAITAAHSAGQLDREQYGRKRAAEIESTLSRFAIKVSQPADVPGLVVRRDGVDLGRAAWGVAVPVDPGPHVVEASAPGKQPWKTTVEVTERMTEVAVPVLVSIHDEAAAPAAPDAPGAAPGAAPGTESFFTQRRIGLGVGALGIVAVGVGAVFGLQAISANDEAKDHCRTTDFCDPKGLELVDDAASKAMTSTILVAGGAAAIAGGAILFLTAPTPADKGKTGARLRVIPTLDVAMGGFTVKGNW